jgi:glycosyltransferase involved in cell wall biosynthesis
MKKRPRIAFFCYYDPLDKRSWSGIPFYLGQTLQKNVGDVDYLGPVQTPWIIDKFLRAVAKFTRIVFRKEYIAKYSILLNIYAVWLLKRKMKGKHYDFLIAPASASQLGLLRTKIPVVYFGDATYRNYSTTYQKEFKNLSGFSRWEGEFLEKRALQKSSLIMMTSEWAKQSVIRDYGISPDMVEINLFGANMDFIPPANEIFEKENNQILTLLFLAVDWERKGGALAFDTLVALREMKVEARLIVCGCHPPAEFSNPNMQVIPFLNKNNTDEHKLFVRLLSNCHFLILPTRADCSLIVACESNSYGVPAITTNVGGVGDAVTNDVNGYCLPFGATGKDYADKIVSIYSNKERYHKLIVSSRKRFEDQLNWDKWAEKFIGFYQHHILNQQPESIKETEKELSN